MGPTPDRRFRDSSGRTIGVEITRLLDSEEWQRQGFARKFMEREVVPRVDERRLPGTIFTHIWHLPWKIPLNQRSGVARILADQIVERSGKLAIGTSGECSVLTGDSSAHLTLHRGSSSNRHLNTVAMSDGGWDSEERHANIVRTAIEKKAAKGQLKQPDIDHGVLLLHDRLPGISSEGFSAAIASLSTDVLSAFEEIFLVDNDNGDRCLKGWPPGPA